MLYFSAQLKLVAVTLDPYFKTVYVIVPTIIYIKRGVKKNHLKVKQNFIHCISNKKRILRT